MKLAQLIEFLRNRLKTVVRVCLVLLALLVVLDAIPAVVDKEHAHTPAEHWPAFWTMFGLLGCGVLVLISKLFGRFFVSRREDYYDE
jgi:TRAP-type C4-dicarboxylate transport system permease small subunit